MSDYEQEKNLRAEVEQLITDGDRCIERIAAHVEVRRGTSPEVEEAFRAMQEAMDKWHAYRRSILEATTRRFK